MSMRNKEVIKTQKTPRCVSPSRHWHPRHPRPTLSSPPCLRRLVRSRRPSATHPRLHTRTCTVTHRRVHYAFSSLCSIICPSSRRISTIHLSTSSSLWCTFSTCLPTLSRRVNRLPHSLHCQAFPSCVTHRHLQSFPTDPATDLRWPKRSDREVLAGRASGRSLGLAPEDCAVD